MIDIIGPALPVMLFLAYPAYLLLMAGVLALCGVSRADIAKWALRQADRQRLVDLLRAARGVRSPADGQESTPQVTDASSQT